MKDTHLQKNIMRRVYYAFLLRVATHPVTMHVVVLAGVVYALKEVLHIAAIYRNILQVPLGNVMQYLAKSLINTEMLTLCLLALALATVLSLKIQLRMPRMQMAV